MVLPMMTPTPNTLGQDLDQMVAELRHSLAQPRKLTARDLTGLIFTAITGDAADAITIAREQAYELQYDPRNGTFIDPEGN